MSPQFILVDFPHYSGPALIKEHPTWVPVFPVERRLICNCCSRTQIPLRPGFGTTIHSVQGMTIGNGNINRYIVISPGTNAFESRNPGIMYVVFSRAKSAGDDNNLPDFAFHPHVLINQDRVIHSPKTKLLAARTKEVVRIEKKHRKHVSHFPTSKRWSFQRSHDNDQQHTCYRGITSLWIRTVLHMSNLPFSKYLTCSLITCGVPNIMPVNHQPGTSSYLIV